jgi:hypothetical protein
MISFLLFSVSIFSQGKPDETDKIISNKADKSSSTQSEPDLVEEDVYYFPSRFIALPTGVMLEQYKLELNFLHRFKADITNYDEAKPVNIMGLDNGSEVAFEISYGIMDDFLIGIHRTTFNKTFEFFGQYSFLQEFAMNDLDMIRNAWFSLAFRAGIAGMIYETPNGELGEFLPSGNFQLILDKRIIPEIHLYFIPGITTRDHFTKVMEREVATLGFGVYLAPFGVESRWRFVGEYLFPYRKYEGYNHTWGFGIHIMTGEHLFALIASSTTATTLDTYSQSSKDNELHIGFNMVRLFRTYKKKK